MQCVEYTNVESYSWVVWGDAYFWNIAITRLNLRLFLTKYSIVLNDCRYKMDEFSCKQF